MPIEQWNEPLMDLHPMLTASILERTEVERLGRFAGIDLGLIDLEGSASAKWYNIIDGAISQRRTEVLLQLFVREDRYPNICTFIKEHFAMVVQPIATAPQVLHAYDLSPTSHKNKLPSEHAFLELDRSDEIQALKSLHQTTVNQLKIAVIHGCTEDSHLFLVDRFLNDIQKAHDISVFPGRKFLDHDDFAIEISETTHPESDFYNELAKYYQLEHLSLKEKGPGPILELAGAGQGGTKTLLFAVLRFTWHGKSPQALRNFLQFWKQAENRSLTIFLFICAIDNSAKSGVSRLLNVFSDPYKRFEKKIQSFITGALQEGDASQPTPLMPKIIRLKKFDKALIKQFVIRKELKKHIKDPANHRYLDEEYDKLDQEVSMSDAVEYFHKIHSLIS